MWPTDYYLTTHPIHDWEKSLIVPDDESLSESIPEIGSHFVSSGRTFEVIGIRRWNSVNYTGWVREVDGEKQLELF